jgi:hypothetical protein
VADENGYRVTSMDSEDIGDGPKTDKLGKAIVQQVVAGIETRYAIQAQPKVDEEEEVTMDLGRENGEAIKNEDNIENGELIENGEAIEQREANVGLIRTSDLVEDFVVEQDRV